VTVTVRSRDASVVSIDLDSLSTALSTFDELIKFNTNRSGPDIAVLGSNRGIQRPWDIVLSCSMSNLEKHGGLFESILTSAVRPRLVLLIRSPELAQGDKKLSLPRVFSEQGQQARVIVITSDTGCEWAPGDYTPKGLAVWPGDKNGDETLPMLMDTLSMGEIFNEVFKQSSSAQFEAWCVGTKQVWFGKLPAQPLAAALYEVGDSLVGDDGKVAVLRRLEDWKPPKELIGEAREADILNNDGKKAQHLDEARKKTDTLAKSTGQRGKTQFLKRVAEFPELQSSQAKNLSEDLGQLSENIYAILKRVNATDGFEVDERNLFDTEGIKLNRDDDLRAQFETLDNSLRDTVVVGIRKAISQGHSIAPLKIQLQQLIEAVTPRSVEEVVEQFGPLDLSEERARIIGALSSIPKGPLMRVGRRIARVLQPLWARFILLALYLWGLFTTCFEIFDKGKTRGYIPLPQSARFVVAVVSIILFVLLTIGIMICGLLLNRAHKKIVNWGRLLGINAITEGINYAQSYLEQTALNDWVLSKIRRDAVKQLTFLLEGLENVSVLLRRLLIEEGQNLAEADVDVYSPNPAVRKDYNDYAKVGVFKNMKMVTDILRMDISTIIEEKLELRVPELRGIYRNKFPGSLLNDLEVPLQEYVQSVIKRGALSQELAQSEEASQQRRELTDTYWKDVSVIDRVVQDVVLVEDNLPIVQFINPQNLLAVAKDQNDAVNVRFAPDPSKNEVSKSQNSNSDLVSTVVFTESVTCAGIIRLAGFRQGFVSYT
jgi:hypothetical protein